MELNEKGEHYMTDKWSFLATMKPSLQEIWNRSGFMEPTAVQKKVVPLVLDGKDIIAESPTGTGKTVAYLLPLLQQIESDKKGIQAVILASSHELVMQIHQEIQKWSDGSGIIGASFIGGVNVKRQIEKLKKRPQVIVGTPGRIHELIKLKKIKMHEVKTIVLDEGDQLLVPEHVNTVKNIIKSSLNDRQILFFSATLPANIKQIAKELSNQPELITIKKDEIASSNVEHFYFVCEMREKINFLKKISQLKFLKALVFVKDIGNLTVLAEKLQYKDVRLGVLHSESKKQERATTLENFRTGKLPLILATDVAARGLDIAGLTYVIHFDIPQNSDQYIHRSGRTGRMGESGTVISIVTEREERELKQFARQLEISVHKKVLYKGQIVDESERSYSKPRPSK